MTAPYASSLYRLADTEVLLAVAQTEQGPAPLFTEVSGEPAVVAWTDLEQARADVPESHQLFSMPVAELLAQLPPHAGLVVDPRAASPVHVAAGSKAAVLAAAQPFPAGAPTRIGDPADEPVELLAALRSAAPSVPGLRRLWRTWYQVADARPRLLVVYATDDPQQHGPAAADAVVAAARQVQHPGPLLVLAVEDLPAEHRTWLLESTPPLFEAG